MIKKGTSLMKNTILKGDSKRYSGKYVAVRSFKNNEVLCTGRNPSRVLNCAKKQARNPVIFYVPKKDVVHIY